MTHTSEGTEHAFEEWNMDTALKVRYAEGMERGREESAALLRQERERSRQERETLLQRDEEIRRLRKLAGLPDGE